MELVVTDREMDLIRKVLSSKFNDETLVCPIDMIWEERNLKLLTMINRISGLKALFSRCETSEAWFITQISKDRTFEEYAKLNGNKLRVVRSDSTLREPKLEEGNKYILFKARGEYNVCIRTNSSEYVLGLQIMDLDKVHFKNVTDISSDLIKDIYVTTTPKLETIVFHKGLPATEEILIHAKEISEQDNSDEELSKACKYFFEGNSPKSVKTNMF